jgi:hypothetical protein
VLKYFYIPFILACHLQIYADPDPAYHFDADPDPDFYLMRMSIRVPLVTWIRIHNTAQNTYCFPYRRLNRTTMAVTLSRDGRTASVGRQWITILTNQRTRIPLMPLNNVAR